MELITYIEPLRTAGSQAPAGSSRHAVLCRLETLSDALLELRGDNSVRPQLREKAECFLGHIEAAWQAHETRLFQTTFALNVVGEAIVRSDLVHSSVVQFLQVGLYFYGLETIERRWSHRAVLYGSLHAQHLEDFLSRSGLRAFCEEGRQRLASGRIFCLTYHYLSDLRKSCWKGARRSSDVLDVATVPAGAVDTDQILPRDSEAFRPDGEEAFVPAPRERVALMLHIFGRSLTPTQRWIYLAKNRGSLDDSALQWSAAQDSESDLADWLQGLLGGTGGDGDLGWTEIAERLQIHEKTAKREYLRALELLLRESAREVFGETIQSAYVRRVLSMLRSVIQERDLRIKTATGRGLGTLVAKWEVALRFVLNHEKVPA